MKGIDNKEHFKDIVKTNITREGIDNLMFWLENSDFYIAPASTRFHESYPGGLCEHSINVYYHLLQLNRAYETNLSLESMTIVSLFHDLCKVNCYSVGSRNVKDEETGKWHKEPCYQWSEQNKFGGHGSKSVYLVQHYVKLYFDEAAAINSHMGIENGNCNAIMDAYRDNPLAFLLHTADMASTIPSLNDILGLT
ncbi:HD domain-containing protein [bacterium]|nr:HD domain-containing protein [bacterium]